MHAGIFANVFQKGREILNLEKLTLSENQNIRRPGDVIRLFLRQYFSDESIDEISLKEQIINKVSCQPGDLIIEKHAAKEVTKMLEKHETAAVSRYIKKFLDDWRAQKVSIAVYGDKDHGKSQLINTLRLIKIINFLANRF